MSGVATAIVGGATISGLAGANATGKAADSQRDAASMSTALQREIYEQNRADQEPWRDAGVGALNDIDNFNDSQFTAADMNNDPGAQYRMEQGRKSLEGSAAARGMLNSGRTLKELTRYGQDYASNEFGNAYARHTNEQNTKWNRLASIAGVGQNSVNQTGAAGQNFANQAGSNMMGAANATGAAAIAQGNNISNMVGTGMTAYGMYAGRDKVGGSNFSRVAFSDSRLKTDIKEITKESLAEMKRFLKPYAYKYKNEKHGQGEWIGVMAQDLEKSELGKTLVIENKLGEKMIDLKKVLSMFLATMAEA